MVFCSLDEIGVYLGYDNCDIPDLQEEEATDKKKYMSCGVKIQFDGKEKDVKGPSDDE